MSYLYVSYVEGDATRQGTCVDATGVFATEQTGSFIGLGMGVVYASLTEANAQATTGDTIYVNNLNDKILGAGYSVHLVDNVKLYSVSDTDITVYLKGSTLIATTGTGSGALGVYGSNISINGFLLVGGHYFSYQQATTSIYYNDCEFQLNFISSTSTSIFGTNFKKLTFNNCYLNFSKNQNNTLTVGNTTDIFINSSIEFNKNFFTSGLYSGMRKEMINCDLTGMTTSGSLYISSTVYAVDVKFLRCKLPPNISEFHPVYDSGSMSTLSIISCTHPDFSGATDDDSAYWFFYFDGEHGVSQVDTTNYLSATYDGTNGFSALLSSTNASIGNPLRHKLLSIPAQDLTVDKLYKVHFSSDTVLTDANFWIEVERNDATDQALGVVQSTRNADILSPGTAHIDNGELGWTLGGTNTFDVSDEILAMVGVDNGSVSIYACLAEPNTDVWVCPKVIISTDI